MAPTTYKFECCNCGKKCERELRSHPKYKGDLWKGRLFCSLQCLGNFNNKTTIEPCGNCGKLVEKIPKEIKDSKSGKVFCSRSCSASFNNKFKRKTNRSKCEKLLFNLISEKFPDLEILSNDKTMLNGLEADIAIPSLRLAIEWNGPVHFKPIYGEEKLRRIQEIDRNKLEIASRNDINLIVIPDYVSKKSFVLEVFEKIKKIINDLRSGTGTV